jgi:hypothetical protein
MSRTVVESPRAWACAAIAVAVVALCGACAGTSPRRVRSERAATTAPVTTPATASAALRDARAARGYVEPPPPVSLVVPAIGLRVQGLVPLTRLADGTINVPPFGRAGWWSEGPKPGARGPAVLLGHVDTKRGPDVFYRLRDLRPGDLVIVGRADGTAVRFMIDRVQQFPKTEFPSQAVYAPTLDAGLRLVTCGGSFDPSVGHYRDNVVAFATEVS